MHDCPSCGQACDCDGEDLWHDNYPDCIHDCEEAEDDYYGETMTMINNAAQPPLAPDAEQQSVRGAGQTEGDRDARRG